MATRNKLSRGGRGRARARANSDGPGASRERRRPPMNGADLGRIRADLRSLRRTVENDHDHRLRRIETDLRWVIVLLGGQTIALVGAAVGGVLGG